MPTVVPISTSSCRGFVEAAEAGAARDEGDEGVMTPADARPVPQQNAFLSGHSGKLSGRPRLSPVEAPLADQHRRPLGPARQTVRIEPFAVGGAAAGGFVLGHLGQAEGVVEALLATQAAYRPNSRSSHQTG